MVEMNWTYTFRLKNFKYMCSYLEDYIKDYQLQ